MTIWSPKLTPGTGAYYVALADALSRDVEQGRLAPGTRMPTHRELARQLGVNVGTVSRAYAEATRRGAIQGEVGRGTFVRGARGSRGGRPDALVDRRGLIDLAFNIPIEEVATAAVPAVLAEIARSGDAAALFEGYHAAGLSEHRAAGAEWLAAGGLAVDPARLLVLGGGQHAMAVTFATLTQSSDVVLTEALTYTGMKALAGTLGLRLEPVACDAEGLLPDAFEAACRRHAPKALYTMPTLQNPTGVVMPAERRRAVADIARKHGVALVEDDTYGRLAPDAPPPLATFAPERTYFLTGTSKSIAAGLRVGYLVAPDAPDAGSIVDRLTASVVGLTWMAAPLTAEIATRWIRSGTAQRVLETKTRACLARRTICDRVLGDRGIASGRSSPHVWLPLPEPWRGEAFFNAARSRGVVVSPAELFVVGRAGAPHAVRVCLGTPRTVAEVEPGQTLLAELLGSSPTAHSALV
jgi:DNA-binding transcriptional MocR family regulator